MSFRNERLKVKPWTTTEQNGQAIRGIQLRRGPAFIAMPHADVLSAALLLLEHADATPEQLLSIADGINDAVEAREGRNG